MLRHLRIRHPPAALLRLADLGVTLVGAQGIAAGGDEIDDPFEHFPRKAGIGRGRDDLVIELERIERLGAGHAEDVLGENIERTFADRRRILGAEVIGIERRLAFHHLEPVAGHEDRLRGFVHAVIGAADALGETRGALGRADMEDEIDIAPVDAHVERRGGDDGAQLVFGHRRFHLAALAGI